MAKYLQGINGIFVGKVGTVVGCVWKGIPYMRAKGRPRTSVPSEKEETNRNKFKTAHAWLQPPTPLFEDWLCWLFCNFRRLQCSKVL